MVTVELPGLWVEDKGLSLAVHYRQSPRKAEARRRVIEAASKSRTFLCQRGANRSSIW